MDSVRIQVLVRLKPGVLDVQGKTVQNSMTAAFPEHAVGDVRVGKLIELTVEAASDAEAIAKGTELCEQILTNPVIESFEIKSVS